MEKRVYGFHRYGNMRINKPVKRVDVALGELAF